MKSNLRVFRKKQPGTVSQRIKRILRVSKTPARPAPPKSTGNPVRTA